MEPNYTNLGRKTLSLIYTRKYNQLSSFNKEKEFPQKPPKDEKILISKLNEMDNVLGALK